MPRKEECASGMGQSKNDAAAKDVQTKSSEEVCASDMGRIAHKTDLQHLDQNLNRLLQLKPTAINELPGLPSEGRKEAAFLKR